MVAGGLERILYAFKKILSIVPDGGGFSVHQFLGPDNFTAECLAQALMP
jgi:hypothetical protein